MFAHTYDLSCLQAQSRLGGRCYTSKDSFPAPVDLGCSWIHGYAEGTPVRDLVEELGIVSVLWCNKVSKPAD